MSPLVVSQFSLFSGSKLSSGVAIRGDFAGDEYEATIHDMLGGMYSPFLRYEILINSHLLACYSSSSGWKRGRGAA